LDQAGKCGKRQPNNIRNAPVSELTVADATNRVYESLQADNADIDLHIAALKAALKREGLKEALLDPAKLVQNNRSGRKLLQSYFRQRGVTVKFAAS
jgi:predicted nucleic acid-binding Zn ribbon protein